MNKFSEQNKATAAVQDKKTKNTANPTITPATAQTTTSKNKQANASSTTATDKKDAFNGKWPSQMKAAKSNWNKLTDAELEKSAGNEMRLTELVQQRYALSKDVAQ